MAESMAVQKRRVQYFGIHCLEVRQAVSLGLESHLYSTQGHCSKVSTESFLTIAPTQCLPRDEGEVKSDCHWPSVEAMTHN